jgi:hypothetical protein
MISQIKARLVEQGVFGRVQGAAQLAVALDRRQFAGADAYLVLSAVKPGENHLINAVSQRLIETYSVIFWTASAGDATGDAVVDLVEAKRAQVIAALLGWSADADHSPLYYAGGVLSRFEAGAVLWEDSFTTDSYLRATP